MDSEEKEPLYPPVLPSWGSMLPATPPSGYGDVRFEPAEEGVPSNPPSAPTALDRRARTLLSKLLPTSARP
jgi:hypothetical protein